MNANCIDRITSICKKLDVPTRYAQQMKHFTSLKVGGEIDCIAYPETKTQAAKLVHELHEENIFWSSLGYGTNLLVKDNPIHRVAISLRNLEDLLTFEGTKVFVHAGYSLPRLVNAAADRGLSGIQGLAPIPGSVGGAVKMNAGSHGYEIADVIESVSIAREGNVIITPRSQLEFSYRHSPFKNSDLILGTVLQLFEGNSILIKEEIAQYRKHRAETQPVRSSSAGCIFKNPDNGITTGRIIDQLGLKGAEHGGATVSSLHANFIVTNGNATAADIFSLIDVIKERVVNKHNLELELEVEVWE